MHRWRYRLAQRAGARTFTDLVSGRGPGARHQVAEVVVLGVCALVAAGVVAELATLGWAVPTTRLGFWHWGAVLVLAIAAWVVVPRAPRLPGDVLLVSRGEAPTWWGLVDEVASVLGTRPPDQAGFDRHLNAAAARVGTRFRSTVIFGMPLWCVLLPQERVAILAHEIGHFRHADVRRSVVVSLAMGSLERVLEVLWPDAVDEEPTFDETTLLTFLVDATRRVLALPFLGLLYVLDRASASGRPRQEYLADLAASAVAGTEGTRTSLLRLLSGEGTLARVQAAVRRREDVWASLGSAPPPSPRELRRLLRACDLTGHQQDETHPPTHLRVRLVDETEGRPAQVVVDAARSMAIERELDGVRERMRRGLTDDLLE